MKISINAIRLIIDTLNISLGIIDGGRYFSYSREDREK
jgi:hypothetical protein